MDRINGPDWIDIGGGRRGFRDEDNGGGVAGTEVTARWLNDVQEEMLYLVEVCGFTPAAAVNTLVARAVRSGALNYRVGGGTANALVVALDPGLTAYTAGLVLRIIPAATNTGAMTIDAGAGAIPLRYVTGAEMIEGEVVTGRPIEVLCLGTSFMLMNPVKYFERQTPKASRQTRAFTAATALSDIPPATLTVTQSVTITAASYIDATAYMAFKNNDATPTNMTSRLRLMQGATQIALGDYLGCAAAAGVQVPMTLRQRFTGLNPALTYTLQLVVYKELAVGPVAILDPLILALHD